MMIIKIQILWHRSCRQNGQQSLLSIPKTKSSLKRPVPFPSDPKKTPPRKQMKTSKKTNKPTKGIQAEPCSENASSDDDISGNDNSDNECSSLQGIKFTVKGDWEGQINYFPANEEHFQMYYPQGLEENDKPIWERMVNDRKQNF